ncbi:thiamine pyrophosphate-binding protein [Nonomuraea sp. SMC257]|uniref:Thiamine pyrophosphate-binding protein n=1 Tax=Nonomuraea montanisoli TaxID=2741721 RepID=A0A7Y6IBH9_9ACTN|nr:thiamine pyrophosphate-binding protein [Nonomuraea montanisoli]NUW34435.1 thiamine pyrophosphate-binding protein [Nonomuraea montanisoli]
MIVAEAVGRTLASLGAEVVFGVVGSGNFHVTNALVAHGARFVATRHEGGAATAADAYARTSGKVGIVSVHQGPGLTNAMTGVAEAAKSRTPLVVLAGEVTDPRSNFHIDQDALARAVGAVPLRVSAGADAVEQTVTAFRTAWDERRTVLLNLPLGAQADAVPWRGRLGEFLDQIVAAGRAAVAAPHPAHTVPDAREVAELAGLLAAARRPVFVAGRGARHARRELAELAGLTGALLATSAVARGLFRGDPWDLDVSGGFATPVAAELIRGADLIVGWGCALNMWTTRHGALVGPDTTLVQVDLDDAAIGLHRTVRLGVIGDTAATARAAIAAVTAEGAREPDGERGYRSPATAARIAAEGRWRAVPYTDESGGGRVDPRTLTIALDDLLPAERTVAVDSGNFMGYPSMFLDVPDERGLCFTQAFQSVGLGLATAVGAAVARPDRLTVAALGDGGAFMGASELETVVRLGLPLVVVVYDDEAYGAEVHHFGPHGHPLGLVTFPPADLAAIGRGYGFDAVTVTEPGDLSGVAEWLEGARERPLLVHARVTRDRASWWLEEAFRGH